MAPTIAVTLDPKWDETVARLASTNAYMRRETEVLVALAAEECVKEARHQLDVMVYNAPLPPSAGSRGPYQGRSGATRRAVRVWGPAHTVLGGAEALVIVDPSIANRKGFFYPAVLEAGRPSVNYWPRPFWRATRSIMAIRFRLMAEVVMERLKANYHP
jgi:hypothetical protein